MVKGYVLDGELEFTRDELIDFLVDTIEENELKLRNILPRYTVRQNCKHHPVRIAREIGFSVVTLHD